MLIRLNNFLSKKQETLIEIKAQLQAYSNIVYIIVTDKAKYIYKEFKDQNINEKIISSTVGPKILVDEENYRIEEYIDHEEVNMKTDYLLVAKKLQEFHNLNIKGITDYKKCLEDLVNINIQIGSDFLNPKMDKLINKKNSVKNIIMKIFTKIHPLLDSSVLKLCHMDLQVGNMLKIKNEVIFIDYEYSCMANPALDVANFFCETMTDYNSLEIERSFGLNEEQKIEFIKEYLKSKDYREFLNNVNEMEIFSHFYWYLWGRKHLLTNQIVSEVFDYKKFTLNRLKFLEEICDGEYSTLVEEIIKFNYK